MCVGSVYAGIDTTQIVDSRICTNRTGRYHACILAVQSALLTFQVREGACIFFSGTGKLQFLK